ncbi:MAG: hypothetical protein ABIH86_07460 [Planctomycetota bacterium]
MKKTIIPVLLVLSLFSGARLAAAPIIGIGMEWGVGYELFQDSRMIGTSQIINLNFYVRNDLTLFVVLEEQNVELDDDGNDVDFKISYNGIGLSYETSWARAGLTVGKGDIRYPFWFAAEETSLFVDIFGSVYLIKEDGKKISYHVSIALKYRFFQIEDLTMANFPINSDVESGNGAVAALLIGVEF